MRGDTSATVIPIQNEANYNDKTSIPLHESAVSLCRHFQRGRKKNVMAVTAQRFIKLHSTLSKSQINRTEPLVLLKFISFVLYYIGRLAWFIAILIVLLLYTKRILRIRAVKDRM